MNGSMVSLLLTIKCYKCNWDPRPFQIKLKGIMYNKSMRSRNKHPVLGVAQSILSVIERIPAAVVDLMKWDLAFKGLGKGIFVCLFAAVVLLLVPKGGDGCASFREGCTRASANMGICWETTGRGDRPAPSAALLAELWLLRQCSWTLLQLLAGSPARGDGCQGLYSFRDVTSHQGLTLQGIARVWTRNHKKEVGSKG